MLIWAFYEAGKFALGTWTTATNENLKIVGLLSHQLAVFFQVFVRHSYKLVLVPSLGSMVTFLAKAYNQ